MPLTRRTLIGLRWQVVGYGIGLVAWAALVAILFPAMHETYQQMQVPEAYRELFGMGPGSLGEFRTFASVEFMQWVPVLLAIYVITAATGTLAGEEGRGSLEILLTQPVSRRRLFLEKTAGVALGAVAITALAAVGFAASVALFSSSSDVAPLELILVTFATLPLVAVTGSLALLLGAVAPSRGTAAALIAAVVVAAWLANGLGGLSSQTAWLKYVSGFYYADIQSLLDTGVTWWHQALLIAVTLLQVGLALLAFERRDIEVARWQAPWLAPATE